MPTRNGMPSSGTPAGAFGREQAGTWRSPGVLCLEINASMPYIAHAISI